MSLWWLKVEFVWSANVTKRRARFCRVWIFLTSGVSLRPQVWHPYIIWDENIEWYRLNNCFWLSWRKCLIFAIIPIALESLVIGKVQWLFPVRNSSRKTPRYLRLLTGAIRTPFTFILIKGLFWEGLRKNISSVLVAFNDILFANKTCYINM